MMLRKLYRPALSLQFKCIQSRLLLSVHQKDKKSIVYITSSGTRTWLRKPHLSQSLSGALPSLQCHRHFMDEVDITKLPRNHPEKGELVYLGGISKMIKLVKAFSLSTSITGLAIQPFLISKIGVSSVGLAVALGTTFTFFIFLTPLLLHWFTKRYITKMYFKPSAGTFTATTYSLLLREKEHIFKASDVIVPDIPGILATCMVDNKPMFLDANSFLSKDAYIHLMSYDQPLEWELPRAEDIKPVNPKDTSTRK